MHCSFLYHQPGNHPLLSDVDATCPWPSPLFTLTQTASRPSMQRAPTRRAPDGLSSDPVPQRQATTAAGRSAIPPPMPPRVPDADQLAVAQSLPLRRKTTKRVPNTRAAGQPDAMPLNRAATRRVPAGASARINYQSVQQGFKELYSPTNDNASVVPDVEYVPPLPAPQLRRPIQVRVSI